MSVLNENEYEECEEKVLELFEDLNIISFPINPFYIAEKMKILLVKYSDFGL